MAKKKVSKTPIDDLNEFTANNGLEEGLDDSGSAFNGALTVLVGYCLYKKYSKGTVVDYLLDTYDIMLSAFDPVWESAERNNYGDFWVTKRAHEMYHFD